MTPADQRTAELEAILQGLPELYLRVDASGGILEIHGVPSRDLGPRQELVGKHLEDVLPPDTAAEIRGAVGEVLASGEVATVQYGLEVARGERCFEARISRLTPQQAVVACHDGTQRAHAVAELRESETRYRSVIAALHEGIVVQRRDGTIITCNASAARILGLAQDELTGDALARVCSTAVRDDGQPIPVDRLPSAVTMRTGQSISGAVMGLKRPDGTLGWLSVNTQPLVSPGEPEPYAVVSSFSDITARRGAEGRLRTSAARLSTLIGQLGNGVLLEDAGGRVTLVNQSFCDIFGIEAPPQQLVGSDSAGATGAAAALTVDPQAFLTRIAEVLASTEPVRGDRVTFADGREFDRDHTLVFLDGHVLGRLWVYRDVTESVRSQRELAQARDEAVAAAEEHAAFMATLSHEIRTPLAGLTDHIDRLSRSPLQASQLELVRVLSASIDQMLSVIDDALRVSTLAGGTTVQDVPFIPGDVVDAASALFAPNATRKGIALMHHVGPELRGPMRGDPVRLRQVIDNLISNAVQYTDSGMIEIGATAEDGPDGRPVLTLAVTDTGPGMTDEVRQRLIAGFSAGGGSQAGQQGGTDLGLSIVRFLVDLMGGTIDLSSSLGLGTTFTVSIPLARPDQGARPAAAPATGPEVLLVEDADGNATIAEDLLARLGHRTARARNGEEALQAVLSGPGRFGAILMSCLGRSFDGYEAAREIRQAEGERGLQRTPIVGLTPNGPAGEREECLIAGMSGCVGTPLQAGEIREALTRWASVAARGGGMVRLGALDRLVSDRGGDMDAVGTMVAQYLDLLREKVAAARDATERRDPPGVARVARDLVGPSATVGAEALATLCDQTARQPSPDSAARLAAQAADTEAALRAWLSTVRT